MSNRLRIPLLGFNTSGGIRVIVRLANWLSDDGWDVEIVVPDYYQTESPFPLHNSVHVQVISTRGGRLVRRLFYFAKLVRIVCAKTDVCLATSYLTPYFIFLSWLFRRPRPQLVYLVQGYEPLSHIQYGPPRPKFVNMLLYQLAKWSYRLPFKKIAVSRWVKSKLGDKIDIVVIPNGIDLAVFQPKTNQQSERRVIGTHGRLGKNKDLATFLEATKPFMNQPDIEVRVLTDKETPLPEGIIRVLSGGEQTVVDFYQQCTIFAYTSHVEGFGLPPLEAMACGTAVVMTDSGGIHEFANRENSIIIPAGRPKSLLQAIQMLLEDDALRAELVKNGLATAQHFSLDSVQQQYLDFFSVLIRE